MQIAQKRKALKKTKVDIKRTLATQKPKVEQLKVSLKAAKAPKY